MNSSQNSKMGSKSNFNQKPQSQSQSLSQVPIPIDKFFKIKNLKFLCKVHNSEIGGVCESFSCHSKNQLICIKCFTDSQSCINQQKHNLATFDDFLQNFNSELFLLRKDYNYSKSLGNVEYFLQNSNSLLSNFNYTMMSMKVSINDLFTSGINKLTKMQEEFNLIFETILVEKQKILNDSIEILDDLLNYETLCDYKIERLREKMARMPYENFNTTITLIKKSLSNIKSNLHVKFDNIINEIINPSEDVLKNFRRKFDDIEKNLGSTGLGKMNSKVLMEEEIFMKNEKIEKIGNIEKKFKNSENFNLSQNQTKKQRYLHLKKIETLKLFSEFPIDYSLNSNFIDKKLTIFKHFNGHYILCYPTSLNIIKLENFNTVYSQIQNDSLITSNLTLNKETNLNARDRFLCLKLYSHSGRITNITQYKYDNKDFIVSSSEDKTIKIWDISSLQSSDMNKLNSYNTSFIKTLTHVNKITCFEIFQKYQNEINQYVPMIISITHGEKIKVWDFISGIFIRDFEENENYDTVLKCFRRNNIDLVITANQNFNVKIWDFDSGRLISQVKYISNHQIVSILPSNEEDYFLFIDNSGQSAVMNLNNFELISMNLESFRTERIGAIKWNENSLLIFNKNATVCEFDLILRKFVGKLRICSASASISHLETFKCSIHSDTDLDLHKENYKEKGHEQDLLIAHCGDLNLRIFR